MWSLDPLTAGITAVVGVGLMLIAWSQLSAMLKTSKAGLLEDLNNRFSAMTVARRTAEHFIQEVEEAHKKEKPLEKRKLSEAADFTGRLTQLRKDAPDDYLSLMEICSFFETVGFATQMKYVHLRDIYELYGGAILRANTLFDAYLESQRRALRQQGYTVEAKKYYEYFSKLAKEVENLLTQAKKAESK